MEDEEGEGSVDLLPLQRSSTESLAMVPVESISLPGIFFPELSP